MTASTGLFNPGAQGKCQRGNFPRLKCQKRKKEKGDVGAVVVVAGCGGQRTWMSYFKKMVSVLTEYFE